MKFLRFRLHFTVFFLNFFLSSCLFIYIVVFLVVRWLCPLLVTLDFTRPAHCTSPGGGHHKDWRVRVGVILGRRRWSWGRGLMRVPGNIRDIYCWGRGNRSELGIDKVLRIIGWWSVGEGPGRGEGGCRRSHLLGIL